MEKKLEQGTSMPLRKKFSFVIKKDASHKTSIYGNCTSNIFVDKNVSFLFMTIHRIHRRESSLKIR